MHRKMSFCTITIMLQKNMDRDRYNIRKKSGKAKVIKQI